MNPVYNILVYAVWFLSTYYVVFFLLNLLANRDQLYEGRKLKSAYRPLVSIVVAAFNEEKKVHHTIRSLKRLTYPELEFVIINDGSCDKTASRIRTLIGRDSRFRFIDNDQNKGKAACLNEGISYAKGCYVACMDADSMVDPDIIEKTLPYFEEKVGAVTVSVEVHKPKGFLAKLIDMEYILGLSLFLKVFSFFNCVFVTPGPFSIYRKSVLRQIGGFDETNITEDLEIAYRIHKAGFQIKNCIEAKVKTILPPTFKGVYVQRRRWYSGALRTLFQHRGMLFRRKYGAFSFFMPFNYMLILLGLALFLFTLYLGASHTAENLSYLRYTNIDLIQRVKSWEFDLLGYSRVMFLGTISFLGTVLILIVGLSETRKNYANRKLGIAGYPFLFFLYQLFWLGAIFALVRRRKIAWR